MKKEIKIVLTLIMVVFLLVVFVDNKTTQPLEIQQILETNSLDRRIALYKNLLAQVGFEKAQEYLYHSGLPFTGETHLLNHASGGYAYEQYGSKGLIYCKDYFLASCYHGAVLNIIATEGIESLENTMGYCWEKGAPVAAQCAHAIGHGLLAWFGYKNLPKALETCDYMINIDTRFPLINCHDGVFMENLWGVHENGELSKDRWIKSDDPYYPCNDDSIKNSWQKGCWSNQPSVMYQLFHGDLQKVASYCNAVSNPFHQETCYDGLARQIHPLTEGSTNKAFNFCNILTQKWRGFCLISIAQADFSVGGRELPYEICARIDDRNKKDCYQSLYAVVKIYYKNKEERYGQCSRIKEVYYKDKCRGVI